MLTPEEIQEQMKDRLPKVVAEKTGLHFNTVYKLKNGTAKAPSYETMKIISDYLQGSED